MNTTKKVSLDSIAYFQAAQSYCLLVLGIGKLVPVLIESIKDLKKELDTKTSNIDSHIKALTAKSEEIDWLKKEFMELKASLLNANNTVRK